MRFFSWVFVIFLIAIIIITPLNLKRPKETIDIYQRAVELCREAGYASAILNGDGKSVVCQQPFIRISLVEE